MIKYAKYIWLCIVLSILSTNLNAKIPVDKNDSQLKKFETQIAKYTKQLLGLDKEISQLRSELNKNKKLIELKKNERQALQANVCKQVKLANYFYNQNSATLIHSILNKSIPEIQNLMDSQNIIMHTYHANFKKLKSVIAEIAHKQDQINNQIAIIERQKIQIKIDKDKQNKAYTNRKKILQAYQRPQKIFPRAKIKPQVYNKSTKPTLKFHPPLLQIKSTKIKANTALYLSPRGSKVYAIAEGKIVFANWLRGYGLLLVIDHGGGIMSIYGHNQTLFKTVGDKVSKGEIISLVGESGGYRDPGLYFELRKNGKLTKLPKWNNYEKFKNNNN